MRLFAFLGFLTLTATFLRAAPPALPSHSVTVAPMKTSIYVGSVRLTTGVFTWDGTGFATTYEAKVVPWVFWGESGKIQIQLPLETLERLAAGQTVEFTGNAVNDKNKPREVAGRAQPNSATTGKIKVKIKADGIELIFNSTYEFTPEKKAPMPASAT